MIQLSLSAMVLACLFVAWSTVGAVLVIRALPGVEKLVLQGKKPFACDLCMSWWTSILISGFLALLFYDPIWFIGVLPSVAAGVWILGRMYPAPQGGSFPPLPGDEP